MAAMKIYLTDDEAEAVLYALSTYSKSRERHGRHDHQNELVTCVAEQIEETAIRTCGWDRYKTSRFESYKRRIQPIRVRPVVLPAGAQWTED